MKNEFDDADLDAAMCDFDVDGALAQSQNVPPEGTAADAAAGPARVEAPAQPPVHHADAPAPPLSETRRLSQPSPSPPCAPKAASGGGCVTHARTADPDGNISGTTAATTVPRNADDLRRTLKHLFGFDDFRDRQLEVISAIVHDRRDAACFWATGAGKSLVYQLPALHTGRTAVVASPLISLMEDQTRKLNATVGAVLGRDVAVFLGSAQTDASAERRAFAGDFAVVYVTPEKLAIDATIDGLGRLRAAHGISVIAIDEAHCVSEWGHSFRKDYRDLGRVRGAVGGQVPVVALTATATARVRSDVLCSLGLRQPLLSTTSADRPNLTLRFEPRRSFNEGLRLLRAIARGEARRTGGGSVIVYCATTKAVEDVAKALQSALREDADGAAPPGRALRVVRYHGKLSHVERAEAHRSFLTGEASIVVATSAFGMGIDKPDIRAVVNFEAPKTVEEYWQMVGRAGRDGLPASGLLLWESADFTRWSSSFYTEGMSQQTVAAVAASTKHLRAIAEDETGCRRAALLRFFGEEPEFGTRCGRCDVCERRAAGAGAHAGSGDDRYDGGKEVALLLAVVRAATGGGNKMVAWTHILKDGSSGDAVRDLKAKVPRQLATERFLKDLLPRVVGLGLLKRDARRVEFAPGKHNSFDVYGLTAQGRALTDRAVRALRAGEPPPAVAMAKPRCVVEAEAEAARRRAQVTKELESYGVDVSAVPEDQLDRGEGAVLTAQLDWSRRLRLWRDQGKQERADQLEALLARVLEWRGATAVALSVAPGAVLADHLAKNVAYACPTSEAALRELGVRVKGVEKLAAILQEASAERAASARGSLGPGGGGGGGSIQGAAGAGTGTAVPGAAVGGNDSGLGQGVTVKRRLPWHTLKLPEGVWVPPKPWAPAQAWRMRKSLDYYALVHTKGQGVEAVAARGELSKGKPVLPSTVIAHMQSVVLAGKPADLSAMVQAAGGPARALPSQKEWERLDEAAALLDCDPVAVEDLPTKALVAKVLGHASSDDLPGSSAPGYEEVRMWYDKLRWWAFLKRACVPLAWT